MKKNQKEEREKKITKKGEKKIEYKTGQKK